VSAGFVAGTVRARALVNRRLGFDGARVLAACPSLPAAVALVAGSPYGRGLPAEPTLVQAQRTIAGTALWHLRVLAGWLPSEGVQALRVLAGWFELSNVDGHMARLTGGTGQLPYRLGALATAWPRLATTRTLDELRTALAASPWRDPGGATVRDIQLALRLSWADRVRSLVPAAGDWARGAAALLTARELFLVGQPLPPGAVGPARRLLGPASMSAASVAAFAAGLPPVTARLFRDRAAPEELWRCELRWWAGLRADAMRLLAAAGFSVERAVGAAGLLGADAFLVRAALAVAARGGTALEDFDALA
jgi:hypothetical protein